MRKTSLASAADGDIATSRMRTVFRLGRRRRMSCRLAKAGIVRFFVLFFGLHTCAFVRDGRVIGCDGASRKRTGRWPHGVLEHRLEVVNGRHVAPRRRDYLGGLLRRLYLSFGTDRGGCDSFWIVTTDGCRQENDHRQFGSRDSNGL